MGLTTSQRAHAHCMHTHWSAKTTKRPYSSDKYTLCCKLSYILCFCFVASHPGAHLTVNTHPHHSLAALHLIFKLSTDKYVWIYGVQYSTRARLYAWMLTVCENTRLSTHMLTRVHTFPPQACSAHCQPTNLSVFNVFEVMHELCLSPALCIYSP